MAMDVFMTMTIACLGSCIGLSAISFFLGAQFAVMGGVIAIIPGLIIWWIARRTGVLTLMMPQKRGEVMVFYVSKTRRIYPILGKELLEGFIKLKGYGRVRVTRNSDYAMFNRKVVIARQGTAHTVPLEQVKRTQQLAGKGYHGYLEAMKGEKLMTKEEAQEYLAERPQPSQGG